ncbi:23S rRNA (uracil(1939)-C(5))-methyltransferase RlmD [Pediococcus argentinicus]|uniref:23S rRNA (uracil(1939)-C(5))-methyltransferase RlmD n=1 Tax=Pediococcus argentinicus TaxID=480391 RepID=UPI00338F4303
MKFIAPVEKNKTYEVTIEDLTYQGMGVAKIENFPIFIANSLPGEQIEMGVTKVQKTYAFGRVVKVIKESPDRVEGSGVEYTQTGIAPLQNLAYPAQLKFKQQQIQNLLNKDHLDDIKVDETIGMENPTGYRNKAQIPVRNVQGDLNTGFFRRNSHDLVPIEDFYIQDPVIDKVILQVRDLLRRFHVTAYDERNNSGVIRNVIVRRGYYSHEIMVVLVTRTMTIPGQKALVEEISKIDGVVSIVQNINSRPTNVIMGPKDNVLWGEAVIHDELMGLKFMISAHSFYQVNPVQTEKLYQLAIEKADLKGNETVVDAYSGIGTISLAVAKHVKKVYGVEVVKEAVQDAKLNASLNDIENVKFITDKAERQMAKWESDGLKPDVVFVDPPRKGLAPEVIDSIADMNPKKIVYISCNPATLVRDIQLFSDREYEVTGDIQPVDQFPQTPHVESITVLTAK